MAASTSDFVPVGDRASSAKHRLIIRGDDAGSSSSANESIRLGCEAGTLRNVSVMACGPAFEQAATMLRDLPDVCVGLHVTLNSEWPSPRWGPVSGADRCPTLVDEDGYFRATPIDHLKHHFSLSEAVFETQAQLDRMRFAGIPPVYLDEHMGVSWLPGLRDALASLAEREGLIDVSTAPLGKVQRLPGTICGSARSLLELVSELDEGTHLYITHPDQLAADVGWPGGEHDALARDADRRLLLDPELKPHLQRAGVELVTFPLALRRFVQR